MYFTNKRWLAPFAIGAGTALLGLTACNAPESAGTSPGGAVSPAPVTTITGAPPSAPARSWSTDALLFAGDGTWGSEVTSLESLLTANGMTYQSVTSAQLDTLSVNELAKFGVIIVPGGTGSTEAQSVSAQTHANLREAVQVRGVSYVGFCAGSFVAVAPAPATGQDVSYGFGIVNGPVLNTWTPNDNPNANYEMQPETFADGTSVNLLWYGGPITPSQGVVAKYPSGDPAISEMWSGAGFVVLSGVHPAADQAILSGLGLGTAAPDTQLAVKLIQAALHQQPLPTFK